MSGHQEGLPALGNPRPPLQGGTCLPNGCLCHSPHKLQAGGCSSRQMATPRLRPAHRDPTPEATPWGEAPPRRSTTSTGEGATAAGSPRSQSPPHPGGTPPHLHPVTEGTGRGQGPSVPGESRSLDSLQPHGPYSPWDSPGQDTGVGSHFLLQGIVPAEGSRKDPAVCPVQQGPQRPHVDLPAPRSRGCTPQARLGQLLEGTGHYGFIYRFMGGERPPSSQTPLHTTTGVGGSKSSEPPPLKAQKRLRSGCPGFPPLTLLQDPMVDAHTPVTSGENLRRSKSSPSGVRELTAKAGPHPQWLRRSSAGM